MGVDFRIPVSDDPESDSIERIRGWSYSGFHAFREQIAKMIGVRLDAMQGYSDGFAMQWSALVPHTLHALLNHSDCEGYLSSADCAAMAPALRLLAPRLDHPYDIDRATALADLMELAGKVGRPVQFR